MPGASRRGALTRQEELGYLVTWFTEFSEMQKSDFFKIILAKYAGSNVDAELVASAVSELHVSDRPPTIFHCRMKLFGDWFANWSDEEKEELLIRLKNLDSSFMETFQKTMDGSPLEEESLRQPILQLRPACELAAANHAAKQMNGNGTTNGACSSPDQQSGASSVEAVAAVSSPEPEVEGESVSISNGNEVASPLEVQVEG